MNYKRTRIKISTETQEQNKFNNEIENIQKTQTNSQGEKWRTYKNKNKTSTADLINQKKRIIEFENNSFEIREDSGQQSFWQTCNSKVPKLSKCQGGNIRTLHGAGQPGLCPPSGC